MRNDAAHDTLENLLTREDDEPITVKPDGTFEGEPPVTFRRDLGGKY